MNDLTQQERLDGRTDYGYNEFDDGIDFSFKKYFVAIPDTFINWKAEGAKNFRFRLRVLATAHNYDPAFVDDADDFIVDNVQIITNPEAPDLEVLSIKADQPYAMLPASQATDIPITVQVSNNANIDASTFSVKVKIFRLIDPDLGVVEEEPIYCRTVSVSNLTSLRELNIGMPSWNARKSQREGELTAHYRMMAIVNLPEVDYEPLNDTNYTDMSLTLSTVFAYDGVSSYWDPYLGNLFEGQTPVNSVSSEVAPGLGRGLTLFGSNFGGANSQRQISFTTDRAGVPTGNGSGEIAMKFTLNNPDTVRGYQAYFGSLNASPEWILFRLISDNGSTPGNETELGSEIVGQRMRMYVDGEILPNILPNQYVTYILDEPLPLDPGGYWLSIAQLNQTGLELGGSANRMGMRTLNFFVNPNNGVWGESGNVLLLDKQFRTEINNNLFNQNFFAYSDGLGSDEWVQFTPSVGNPAYPQWNHNGDIPPGMGPMMATVPSLSNGSWIPMLRPWFGPKAQGSAADVFEWCPDDIPVEMINFTGEVRKGSIDLNWETASEENNYGFEVERRLNGEDEAAWNKIGFVSGHGNSNNLIRYNYSDKDVALNQTYDYRLKQMDFDGTESCATSNIVTLTYESIGELVLNQNSPNPFYGTNSTRFSFNLPQNEVVTVEILDMYGNVVKTLIDGESMSASEHHCQWDGIGQDGNPVSSGTYIYRLKAGNETRTQKMSVIK